MNILPVRHSTFVVSYPAEEVMARLHRAVKTADFSFYQGAVIEDTSYFVGTIKDNQFIISRKFAQYQNFLPRIKGRVESTSIGSIIFVSYSIFYSAAVMIILFSLIALFIGLVFLLFEHNVAVFMLSMGAFLLNYVVTIVNFNRQVDMSRQELEKLLNK